MIYTIHVDYPGLLDPAKDPNVITYVNMHIDSPAYPFQVPTNLTGLYPGWCLDPYDDINVGQQYTAEILRLTDPLAQSKFVQYYQCNPDKPPNFKYWKNLLCLFNKVEAYSKPPYSFSYQDIQSAIWTLLFTQNPATDPIIPLSLLDARLKRDGILATVSNTRFIILETIACDLCCAKICTDVFIVFSFQDTGGCVQITCFTTPIFDCCC